MTARIIKKINSQNFLRSRQSLTNDIEVRKQLCVYLKRGVTYLLVYLSGGVLLSN